MIFVLIVVDVVSVIVFVVVDLVDVVFVASERPGMQVLPDVLRTATPHWSKRATTLAHVEVFRIVHRYK